MERLGHALASCVALERELDRGLEQLLHVERGDDLDAAARDLVAAVGETMHAAGGDDDGVAGTRHDLAQAHAELHRALEHVEGLRLLGVNVRAGHVAVGAELELDLQLLAVGVGGGPQEVMRSPLTGFSMVCPV